MERAKRETMSVENIGKSTNNGSLIPKETETRELKGVLGTNISYTAYTTEKQIEEFSKINENAEWEATNPHYYKIKIVGPLSFNNVCKLIMSKNRCVVRYDGDIVTAETIWIGTLNAIGKFLRANESEVKELQVWEKNPKKNNAITKIESIDSVKTFTLYYNMGPNRVVKKRGDEDKTYMAEHSYSSEPNGHPQTKVCGVCFQSMNKCKCKSKTDWGILIDNRILKTIRTFNKKGYRSFGCCEGTSFHNQISRKTNKRFFSGGVGFMEDYNFQIPENSILINKKIAERNYWVQVDMKNPEVEKLSDDELKDRFLKEIAELADGLKKL